MSALTLAESMLPAWLVIPLAMLTMLLIAAHVLSVQVSPLDTIRKRLRIANGLIMMLVTAMLAYALGIAPTFSTPRADPDRARGFLLVWLAIIGFLGISVAMAICDALATARDALRQRRILRQEMRDHMAAAPRPAGDGPRG